MKIFIKIVLALFYTRILAQSNIIPNGDFESGANYNNTNYCVYELKDLNDIISNWKVSLKGGNNTDPITRWQKFGFCVNDNQAIWTEFSAPLCATPSLGNFNEFGNKVVTLRWTHISTQLITGNCTKIRKDHIGVALENNQKFTNGKKYLIRYKIMPRTSTNINFGNCSSNKINTHLRLFLSKNGPLNWEKNNNPLQELTQSGVSKSNTYPDNNSTPCDWIIVEKSFVPNSSHYTTLIFLMESGGVFLDDVEVFEECENNYMVQNKTYHTGSYPANPPYVTGGTFKEQSGFNLTAGNNIGKPNTPNGDVVIEPLSNINYTAPNKITLKSGFKAKQYSEFKAVIAPCPNNVNKSSEDFSNDTISAWRLFADYENDLEILNLSSLVSIYPNPTQNKLHFTISDELYADLEAIELYDVLGKKFLYNPNREIDLHELNNGYYTIRFVFSNNTTVVKSFIKADN